MLHKKRRGKANGNKNSRKKTGSKESGSKKEIRKHSR
jgi:hypothetical protein